jgi:hypothetical protein
MSNSSGFDQLDAAVGRIKLVTSLPTTVAGYYGAGAIKSDEWRGGEIVFLTGTATGCMKLYIQTATSGKTATWKCIVTQFTTP